MSGFLNQCYLQCAPFSCRKSYTHVSITFNNRPAILGTPSLVILYMLEIAESGNYKIHKQCTKMSKSELFLKRTLYH